MSALGMPSEVIQARKSGQRIIAARLPRPAGNRARAVRMPVEALSTMMAA